MFLCLVYSNCLAPMILKRKLTRNLFSSFSNKCSRCFLNFGSTRGSLHFWIPASSICFKKNSTALGMSKPYLFSWTFSYLHILADLDCTCSCETALIISLAFLSFHFMSWTSIITFLYALTMKFKYFGESGAMSRDP